MIYYLSKYLYIHLSIDTYCFYLYIMINHCNYHEHDDNNYLFIQPTASISINQSIYLSTPSTNQPIINQPSTNQSINLSTNKPTNHQPTNQSINLSTNKPINQPTINQPINQSINLSTNQSTNKPMPFFTLDWCIDGSSEGMSCGTSTQFSIL